MFGTHYVFTTARDCLSYLWPTAWSLGGPAELSLAHTALDPVTAFLLLHNHTTLGTAHGISLRQHALEEQGGRMKAGHEGRSDSGGEQCVNS